MLKICASYQLLLAVQLVSTVSLVSPVSWLLGDFHIWNVPGVESARNDYIDNLRYLAY